MPDPQPGNLGTFEGSPVVAAAMEIRNAAGGLNEALGIEPQVFNIGDETFALLKVQCKAVEHQPIQKDSTFLKRVHVFTATDATTMDAAEAEPLIAAQRDRIQRARDAVAGQQRLDDEEAARAAEAAAAEREAAGE